METVQWCKKLMWNISILARGDANLSCCLVISAIVLPLKANNKINQTVILLFPSCNLGSVFFPLMSKNDFTLIFWWFCLYFDDLGVWNNWRCYFCYFDFLRYMSKGPGVWHLHSHDCLWDGFVKFSLEDWAKFFYCLLFLCRLLQSFSVLCLLQLLGIVYVWFIVTMQSLILRVGGKLMNGVKMDTNCVESFAWG